MPRTTTAAPLEAPATALATDASTRTSTGTATVPAPRQAPRRSRRRPAAEAAPLGSLTQRPADGPEACPSCGGEQVTSLALTLTDGTAVRFSSCRRCEHRRWDSADGELTITDVLAHTRRQG